MKRRIECLFLLIFMAIGIIGMSGFVPSVSQAKEKQLAISKKNFPDKYIRKYLKKYYDKNKDGVLNRKELKKVTKVIATDPDPNNYVVINPKGLHKLPNLKEVFLSEVSEKEIKELRKIKHLDELELDIKKSPSGLDMKKIKKYIKARRLILNAEENIKLKNLSAIKDMKCLKELKFHGFTIKSWNVKTGKNLKKLLIAHVKLGNLKVKNSSIENLELYYCDSKYIRQIKIENCRKLKTLNVDYFDDYAWGDLYPRAKRIIYISGVPNLKKLHMDAINENSTANIGIMPKLDTCEISYKIDFNHIPLVRKLKIFRTDFKGEKLDLSPLSNLQKFEFYHCSGLSSLDVSMLRQLKELYCGDLGMRELVLGNSNNLERLNCYGNQLEILDVSLLPKLTHLDCSFNSLTSLDVRACKRLKELDCSFNRLQKVDIRGIKLDSFDCVGNEAGLNLYFTKYPMFYEWDRDITLRREI